MRTSEERVKELHRRMDAMEEAKRHRRYMIGSAAAFAACLALTVVLAILVSRVPVQTAEEGTIGAAASIFAGQAALGYIVVALMAFCLGALVTVICFRLKRHAGEKKDKR